MSTNVLFTEDSHNRDASAMQGVSCSISLC